MRYINVVVDWYDLVDSDVFSINKYDSLLEDLGFKDGRILFSHFRIPGKSLDEGLTPLMSDKDVLSMLWHVPRDREIDVYVENDVSLVEKQMMEVSLAKGKGVLIEEIVEDDGVENENEASTSKVAPLGEGYGISIYGFFDSNSSDHPPWSFDCKNEKRQQRLSDEFQFRNLHNEEEEIVLLFSELDQLLEHVSFLNVELRESVVGVDPPLVSVDTQVLPIDALVILVDAPVIAIEQDI
ncbi:hypothetical protein Tco_0945021 [Tanacetum coccineum]